jgi:hypothetical protein
MEKRQKIAVVFCSLVKAAAAVDTAGTAASLVSPFCCDFVLNLLRHSVLLP